MRQEVHISRLNFFRKFARLAAAAVEAGRKGEEWGKMGSGERIEAMVYSLGRRNPRAKRHYTVEPLFPEPNVVQDLEGMKDQDVNTIYVPHWGNPILTGMYSETLTTTCDMENLFEVALGKGMKVAPILELSAPNPGDEPKFSAGKYLEYDPLPFWADDFTAPDTPVEKALVRRIKGLLANYGECESWLRIVAGDGVERNVVVLPEAVADLGSGAGKVGRDGAEDIARRLERVAMLVGGDIAFVVDPTPLPLLKKLTQVAMLTPQIVEKYKGVFAGIMPFAPTLAMQKEDIMRYLGQDRVASPNLERIIFERMRQDILPWLCHDVPVQVRYMTEWDDRKLGREFGMKLGGEGDGEWKKYMNELSMLGVIYPSVVGRCRRWNGFTEGDVNENN